MSKILAGSAIISAGLTGLAPTHALANETTKYTLIWIESNSGVLVRSAYSADNIASVAPNHRITDLNSAAVDAISLSGSAYVSPEAASFMTQLKRYLGSSADVMAVDIETVALGTQDLLPPMSPMK